MKSPIDHFATYIQDVGGRKEAAPRLGIGVGQISHVIKGRRGIAPKVAMKIDADTNGAISKAWLRPDLWAAENK